MDSGLETQRIITLGAIAVVLWNVLPWVFRMIIPVISGLLIAGAKVVILCAVLLLVLRLLIDVSREDAVVAISHEMSHSLKESVLNMAPVIKGLLICGLVTLGLGALIYGALGMLFPVISGLLIAVAKTVALYSMIPLALGLIMALKGLLITDAVVTVATEMSSSLWKSIKRFFSSLWESIKEGTNSLWESTKGLWKTIKDLFKTGTDALKKMAHTVFGASIKILLVLTGIAVGMCVLVKKIKEICQRIMAFLKRAKAVISCAVLIWILLMMFPNIREPLVNAVKAVMLCAVVLWALAMTDPNIKEELLTRAEAVRLQAVAMITKACTIFKIAKWMLPLIDGVLKVVSYFTGLFTQAASEKKSILEKTEGCHEKVKE